jgi:hypothetical protein
VVVVELTSPHDERGDVLYPTFKGSGHKRHLFGLAREGETSMAVVPHVQPTFTASEPPGSTSGPDRRS